MEDHNTRVIRFGANAEQARAVADRAAKDVFHNVAFFDGDKASLETVAPFALPKAGIVSSGACIRWPEGRDPADKIMRAGSHS
jgi:hypothetical protein